jgi:hypothetical protein
MSQGISRIVEMFEDIQHQNERIRSGGMKISVKWNGSNPPVMGAFRVYEFLFGLDAFDFSEFREPVKKETVATTHVQDAEPGARWDALTKDLQNRLLPSAPPPMPCIQIAVLPSVLRIQSNPVRNCNSRLFASVMISRQKLFLKYTVIMAGLSRILSPPAFEAAGNALDDVKWAGFCLFINSANVFTNHSEEKEKYA